MGIELKVTAQLEGAVSLFIGPDRLALLESLRDGEVYSPNLFSTPITLGRAGFKHPDVDSYLRPRMGESYRILCELLDSAAQTSNGLGHMVVSGAESPAELVVKDIFERGELARHFNELGSVDVNSMNPSQKKLLEFSKKGLILAVLYANELYAPGRRIEFLKHVKRGNVDTAYKEAMLVPYLVGTAAKTL